MLAGARDFLIFPTSVERLIASIQSVLESEERKRLRLSGQSKALGPKGLVVTVFGAKGGVGKTTVATNLGVALASNLGQSVVLVDADHSFGDVADMLELPADLSIVELVRDFDALERGNVDDALLKHESGLRVLPAPRDALKWRGVTPDSVRAIVHLLASRFDIVLIDTAAMLSELSLAVLEEASIVLWVTSTDFSSINNSLSGLESLRQISYPDGRIRLVLNVTSSEDGVRPAKIEEVLKREFFWTVPYDNRVRVGSQIGKPAILASPDSPGSKSLMELAKAVTGSGSTAVGPTMKKKERSWPFRRKQVSSSAQTADGG
jgi:pilus assembly protein CpaE